MPVGPVQLRAVLGQRGDAGPQLVKTSVQEDSAGQDADFELAPASVARLFRSYYEFLMLTQVYFTFFDSRFCHEDAGETAPHLAPRWHYLELPPHSRLAG
jgi:hypothetical protein